MNIADMQEIRGLEKSLTEVTGMLDLSSKRLDIAVSALIEILENDSYCSTAKEALKKISRMQ